MNADERLDAAQESARQGRYAEALSEYIWFHEHALEEQPSQYGVRLSFALGYWMELAGKYPPARAALQTIRDEKTRQLLSGKEDRALFHDVISINEVLGNEEASHDLFTALAEQNGDFAAQCIRLVMPALCRAFAYPLVRSFMGDPRRIFEYETAQFNESISRAGSAKSADVKNRRLEAHIRNHLETLRQLSQILFETGDTELSNTLYEEAITQINDADVRGMVQAKLEAESQY